MVRNDPEVRLLRARLTTLLQPLLTLADTTVSGAILLREAARTSRRWQTYASRSGFSGALFAVLLFGIWAAMSATSSRQIDTADLGWLGRGLFVGFSVAQMTLAILLAPLWSAAAVIEEAQDRTLEMLVLTRLRPSQILAGKLLSRILLLITIVLGALPVMVLVVNLGGVSAYEVFAVTVHTLTTIVIMATIGAFFALFTDSPMLAVLAAASFAAPFFVLGPATYAMTTGNPYDAAHFSPFAGAMARDLSALLPPLSWLPSLVIIWRITVPLFELKVSNASFKHAFSSDLWRPRRWMTVLVVWGVLGVCTLPFAAPMAWTLSLSQKTLTVSWLDQLLRVGAVGWIWLLFSVGGALGTWTYLRIGMDVVDGIDSVFSPRRGNEPKGEPRVRGNPVWWREARISAWLKTAAPILVTWGLIGLAIFQTGWWLIPGGVLAIGALNTGAALVLTIWMSARAIAEERRGHTLEVLLTTTLPSWRIMSGKLVGVMAPTAPLMCLSLPLLLIGAPHLVVVFDAKAPELWGAALTGGLAWIWVMALWGFSAVSAMYIALSVPRERSAFGISALVPLLWLGVAAVIGQLFPQTPLLAVPARLAAPPLAGHASAWHYLLSTLGLVSISVVVFVAMSARLRVWAARVLALALCLQLGAPTLARAQSQAQQAAAMEKVNQLRMRAIPLADGLVREGRWSSLTVIIDNLGPATSGTLRLEEGDLSGKSSWVREVELPEGSRKQVQLLFRPSSSHKDRLVELTTPSGRAALARVHLEQVPPQDVTLGVLGTDAFGLHAAIREATPGFVPGPTYREAAEAPRLVHTGLIPPSTAPHHSAAFGAFDWLIWPDADPSDLTEPQARALRDWVADGGHLLLTVTDTWRQVSQRAPIAELIPGTLRAVSDQPPAPLLTALHAPTTSALVPMAALTLDPGRTTWLHAQGASGPQWVSATFGLGSVHLVLASLGTSPLVQLPRAELFRQLLFLSEDGYPQGLPRALGRHLHMDLFDPWQGVPAFFGDEEPSAAWRTLVRERLDDIPGVAPVPMSWLVGFSLVYLLFIGPIDYFTLRVLRRQPWTWVSFPIMIVVFSSVALVGTQYTKGSKAVLTRVERVDLLPGSGRWRGDTWFGVFSTRKADLSLRSGFDDAVISPMPVAGFMSGQRMASGAGPGRLMYHAETWTLAYGRSSWSAPAEGDLTVEATAAGLQITNDLPFDLEELVYARAQASAPPSYELLGPLARGDSLILSQSSDRPLSEQLSDTQDDPTLAVALFAGLEPSTDRGDPPAHTDTLLGLTHTPHEDLLLTGLEPITQALLVVRRPVSGPAERTTGEEPP